MARKKSSKSRIQKKTKNIINNIGKAVAKIENKTYGELVAIGFDIQADAMDLTPIVTGNLRASAYTIYEGSTPTAGGNIDSETAQLFSQSVQKGKGIIDSMGKNRKAVIVGFSANYAVYIHGNPNAGKSGAKGASTDGTWLFLLKSLQKNKGRVLKRIAQKGKI